MVTLYSYSIPVEVSHRVFVEQSPGLDVHSDSSPPVLPPRSPLRPGFNTRTNNGNDMDGQNTATSIDNRDDPVEKDRQNIPPEQQPDIQTTPTQPHVKESPTFHPSTGAAQLPGVVPEQTMNMDSKDAQDISDEDNEDFADAIDDFQPHLNDAEHEREDEKHGKHSRGNCLILKMKRTISKAGRRIS